MNDNEFSPEDIKELDNLFARISQDAYEGYAVEFHITRLGAKDMVKEWLKALEGNPDALFAAMENYAYIVEEIQQALEMG